MNLTPTPSRLYRVYWTGRYLERIDSLSRALLAAVAAYRATGSEEPLRALAASLGLDYGGLRGFLSTVLYSTDPPVGILHMARMVRFNLLGLGIPRLTKEANLLVLAAEDRIDAGDLDAVVKHLENLIGLTASLGRAIEEELTAPPTPPEEVMKAQLLHQQQ